MPELLSLVSSDFQTVSERFDTVEMETSSSFAICLLLSFHNCDIGNLFIRNKDRFCFLLMAI
jgi:hypothetical protein